MSDFVEDVKTVDELIRHLEKNNSKMENGHFIFARDKNNSILDRLREARKGIIEDSDELKKSGNLLNAVEFFDKLIRELEKINSKLENGHVIFAWRENRRVLSNLQRMRTDILGEEANNEE